MSEILVQKHKDYYDFENTEELVEDFFIFKPARFVVMKCGLQNLTGLNFLRIIHFLV